MLRVTVRMVGGGCTILTSLQLQSHLWHVVVVILATSSSTLHWVTVCLLCPGAVVVIFFVFLVSGVLGTWCGTWEGGHEGQPTREQLGEHCVLIVFRSRNRKRKLIFYVHSLFPVTWWAGRWWLHSSWVQSCRLLLEVPNNSSNVEWRESLI